MLPPLYKYCKFNENNYDYKNLENDALYFASPTSYNDPYEGVLANDMVDLFEAFFTAQMMHASPKYDAILPKIKPMFRYLKNIINVNNSSDINEA